MEEIRDEERKEYIDFLLRQYRLVDALWFLAVEDKFGLEAAVELNEKIWEEMGSRSAREVSYSTAKAGSFQRLAGAFRRQPHLPVRGAHSSPIPCLSLRHGLCLCMRSGLYCRSARISGI
jgi:hypothetical protein